MGTIRDGISDVLSAGEKEKPLSGETGALWELFAECFGRFLYFLPCTLFGVGCQWRIVTIGG